MTVREREQRSSRRGRDAAASHRSGLGPRAPLAPARARPAPGRRRYHLHTPGFIYAGVTVFTALGALNSQNNLLFWVFGIAVAGLILSGFVSGSALLGVQIERELIAESAVGAPMVVRYRVHNRNRFMPACALTISERQTARRGRPPPTWPAHAPQPIAYVAHVGPRQTVHAEAIVWPHRRGEATFTRLTVSSTFPFGLTRKSVTFDQVQGAIVHPRLLPVRPGLLRRLGPSGGGSAAALRSPGPGGEFYGLREYVPGDSHRMIAWRASARSDQLVVRQTSRPAARRLWVVLDLGPPTPDGPEAERRELAISLGASVAMAAVEDGYAVGLTDSQGVRLPARAGRTALRAMLNELALMDALGAGGSVPPIGVPPPGRSDAFVVVSEGATSAAAAPRAALRLNASEPGVWLAPGAPWPTGGEKAALDRAADARASGLASAAGASR